MMRRLSLAAAAALLSALPLASTVAADLTGKWTTDGRYVFTFARAGSTWTGSVREAATGREFKLADIVVDGERVSFFVVHDAEWDEEVKANGGRAFRNTAAGTLTDTTLTVSGPARSSRRARATAASMRSKASRIETRSSRPASVSEILRGARLNSVTPSRSSRPRIWWLIAACVTASSSAARVKLRWRAAASKARSAFSGGRSRRIAMDEFS